MTYSPVGAGLVQGRTDQGVDYSGSGPLYAVGDGTIISVLNSDPGWEGGTFMALKLNNPPDPLHSIVYYAEGLTAQVKNGDVVKAGQQIGQATGGPHGIEIGWGNPNAIGQALAMGASGVTPQGQNFLNFITGGSAGTSSAGGTTPGQTIGSASNWKSITGGLLTAAGAFVMVTGAVLVATHALGKTGAGRAAIGAAGSIPGVGGTVARIASVAK